MARLQAVTVELLLPQVVTVGAHRQQAVMAHPREADMEPLQPGGMERRQHRQQEATANNPAKRLEML